MSLDVSFKFWKLSAGTWISLNWNSCLFFWCTIVWNFISTQDLWGTMFINCPPTHVQQGTGVHGDTLSYLLNRLKILLTNRPGWWPPAPSLRFCRVWQKAMAAALVRHSHRFLVCWVVIHTQNLSQKKWQERSAVLFLAANWFVVLRMSFQIYAVNLPHNAEANVLCVGVQEGEWLREN